MSLPAEIATYLAGAGLGLTLNTSVFDVPIPEKGPDAAVGILEAGGESDLGGFGESLSASEMERPRFVVAIRGSRDGGTAARALAEAVRKKLRRLGPATLSGTLYHDVACEPIAGPYYDQNGRPRYVIACAAHKAESAS